MHTRMQQKPGTYQPRHMALGVNSKLPGVHCQLASKLVYVICIDNNGAGAVSFRMMAADGLQRYENNAGRTDGSKPRPEPVAGRKRGQLGVSACCVFETPQLCAVTCAVLQDSCSQQRVTTDICSATRPLGAQQSHRL